MYYSQTLPLSHVFSSVTWNLTAIGIWVPFSQLFREVFIWNGKQIYSPLSPRIPNVPQIFLSYTVRSQKSTLEQIINTVLILESKEYDFFYHFWTNFVGSVHCVENKAAADTVTATWELLSVAFISWYKTWNQCQKCLNFLEKQRSELNYISIHSKTKVSNSITFSFIFFETKSKLHVFLSNFYLNFIFILFHTFISWYKSRAKDRPCISHEINAKNTQFLGKTIMVRIGLSIHSKINFSYSITFFSLPFFTFHFAK